MNPLRSQRLAAAGLALALAGCGQGSVTVAPGNDAGNETMNLTPPPPEPANMAEPAPVNATATPSASTLGGVDLAGKVRATGQEPFWLLEIHGSTLVYTDYSVETPQPATLAPAAPVITATSATYSTSYGQAGPMTVTLTAQPCDTPAETVLPLTVKIQVGGQTREGCAEQG
ncbi:hypothetical protein ACFQ1E_05235 [Sphingomonas canadensis]|uniref:Uncharacterized protein n=1 Tax=Sphingomonas canadensis TaxID=1219257 RepID=A0ABW3H2N5_9SPHN|nr:hypothetical protein [Sphingomonas canadensis]MCW3835807.1 hypothetical protein [Sphingomonas canadensis]